MPVIWKYSEDARKIVENVYKFCVEEKQSGLNMSLVAPGIGEQLWPGVASSIPARSHASVEIDHKIMSTVILLSSAESFTKGCCQLQAKVCAWSTG